MNETQKFCLNIYRGGTVRAANRQLFGAIGIWYEMPFSQFEKAFKEMGFKTGKFFKIPNVNEYTSDDDEIDLVTEFVHELNGKVGMLATWVWPEMAEEKRHD